MKKTKTQKGITLIALIITIVVLLILAVVSIKAVQDGGIITHAQNAAANMNKAQIEEKANLTKLEFTTDCYTNIDLKKSIQEFRNRLIEAFEVTEDTNNDNIIEVNDKYAVVIKNTNLDIEVVEITNALKANSLVSIAYEMEEQKEENGVIYSNIKFTITPTMTEDEYKNLITDNNISLEEKEIAVVDKLELAYSKTFNNLDEAIVGVVNSEFNQNFTDIDACLTGLNTERENLYYAFYYNTQLSADNRMEHDDFINLAYAKLCIDSSNYYTTNYVLSFIVDGTEKTSGEISIPFEFDSKDLIGYIAENSTCELILKNTSGVVVASEVIHVRNIVDEPTVLTEEEASGIWSVYSGGTIKKYDGNDTDVVIPTIIGSQKITGIYNNAFSGCTTIKTITMHDGITSIGSGAFKGCTSLASIIIPNNITSIESYMFSDCTSLSTVTMPDGITSIGSGAFKGCTSLASITIPNNVTSIGNNAFERCTSLTNVTIPEKVNSIGDSAFSECEKLSSITIPNSVTSIGHFAFGLCTDLESVTLSENLTSISSQAFDRCTSLTSITIPERVTSLETKAFYGCTSLQSVTILGNVTSIASDTFQYSNNLENIYFKSSTWPSGEPWGATNATVSQLSQ